MSITEQLAKLEKMLDTEHVDLVTHKANEVKPGKTSVYIEPPEITSNNWDSFDIPWVACIISATPTTQDKAFDDIMAVLDEWFAANININQAKPITFDLKSAGTLGGYEVTFGGLDL
ncbi:hypothetical protein OZX72_03010 [Bifidobacterium sp. ESL0769]|uniref:hypothetical protein n=1 Tax=Bifidobacterium sp. ESL0769 TaxID=2983229 RepID=UPI0023F8C2B4|nr:hypothetical protein [Bifidobacterium sp. ESL0769]WEV67967.1 hypothetical protein OZX72_03010 [Bifidobacterium sp. ESL0769]